MAIYNDVVVQNQVVLSLPDGMCIMLSNSTTLLSEAIIYTK